MVETQSTEDTWEGPWIHQAADRTTQRGGGGKRPIRKQPLAARKEPSSDSTKDP